MTNTPHEVLYYRYYVFDFLYSTGGKTKTSIVTEISQNLK